ncbi:FMN reductase [Mesorhizobium sp. B292B1B]|uniref:FMN reductase n=1 Tax=unclassified Mesorhizobium TaxID=325217 RepID=UPI00112982F0|nr:MULTISPECIES: FMN reductase [unclassified Mesorhizobium]MCA0010595.1 FMN reductase [Mesorhizobium sp. B294B1A1]MCA0036211.1 FMN reductase [Mesorhizobium sp. B292B1B]TPM49293.1 FMN reductase [Mesorhizobium sp. B2-3-2]
MTNKLVVGISGNLTRPSKTKAFISHIAGETANRIGATSAIYDIENFGPSLPAARRLGDLDPAARAIVEQLVGADVLVAGSPTFKGSYTGLFKHLFDLLDPSSLRGKPVILAATGGGERHSLIVEHQLRPLFGFFEALTVPTAIYASDKDFADGVLVSEAIHARARQAVAEVSRVVGTAHSVGLAA